VIAAILETKLLETAAKKKLKLKIMAPIDLDNLEAAQKLSEISQVRNVPISYLMMLATDSEHLFIFKTPPLNKATTRTAFHMDDVFYTNDARYVERVEEMLNDIWKRGMDIHEITSGPAAKTPILNVSSNIIASKIIDMMLDNNVDSIVVTENDSPIGIVTESDLVRCAASGHDPNRTLVKDIMKSPAVTCTPQAPVEEAYAHMRRNNIRHLPIVEKNGTLAGIVKPEVLKDGRVKVNMGTPILEGNKIPVKLSGRVINRTIKAGDREFRITCVSMGNPHCVIFIDKVGKFAVAQYGPILEHHPLFPKRTNVEFVERISMKEIRMRTWERGTGETAACGSGACAAVVAGVLNSKIERKTLVHLLGGELGVEWANDEHVYLTGHAEEVFRGEVKI
jgi:diaminopimelate epimerase